MAKSKLEEVFGDKRPVRLQVDSGADITIVTVRTWEETDSPDLQRSVAKVVTVMESLTNIIGHWGTDLSWEGHSGKNVCHVSAKMTKGLMKVDWIEQFSSIREAFSTFVTDGISKVLKTERDLVAELNKYRAEVFKDGLVIK